VVELGTVCDIQLGKMLSPESKVGVRPVPYLRNENVQWSRFNLADVSWMDFTETEERKFRLEPGDLLACEGGEPGRAAIWQGQIERCCYQKALHRIRPRGSLVHPPFVLYRLWLSSLAGEFTGSQTQTTIAHLPREKLIRLSIPLPPLAEQERMAGRLTRQLAAVERARAAAQDRLAAAEALPAAYLREVFEGPEASGLPTRLGDICEVVSGFAWSAPKFNRDGRGLPVIRIQNVDAVSNREFLFWEHEFEDRFLVRHGELLLTLSGSFRVAAWDGPLALLNQRIVKIVPSPGLDVLWFLHAMRVRLGDIEMMGKDALVSNVSINDIRDLEFELPPLPAQRRIAADLARRLGEAEHLAACIREELAAIETLPAALLRAAFGGEPGPEHEGEA